MMFLASMRGVMVTGWRRSLPLVVWIGALVVGVGAFHALGDGALAPPPVTEPGAWSAWLAARDPAVAAAAVLRLVVLALAWYLLGATTVGLVARLLRAARLVRVADALTLPLVRRLLQGALGVGLATAMVGSVTAPVPRPGVDGEGEDPRASVDAVTVVGRGEPTGPGAPPGTAPAPVGGVDVFPAEAEGDAAPDAPVALRLAQEETAAADGKTSRDPEGPLVLRRVGDEEAREPTAPAPPEPGDGTGPSASASGTAGAPAADAAQAAEPEADPGTDTDADADVDADADAGDAPTRHRVVAGESLWSISQDALAEAWGREPTDVEVLGHWRRLIEANRERLPDPDNPDLLFPGDEVLVPPPGDARAASP